MNAFVQGMKDYAEQQRRLLGDIAAFMSRNHGLARQREETELETSEPPNSRLARHGERALEHETKEASGVMEGEEPKYETGEPVGGTQSETEEAGGSIRGHAVEQTLDEPGSTEAAEELQREKCEPGLATLDGLLEQETGKLLPILNPSLESDSVSALSVSELRDDTLRTQHNLRTESFEEDQKCSDLRHNLNLNLSYPSRCQTLESPAFIQESRMPLLHIPIEENMNSMIDKYLIFLHSDLLTFVSNLQELIKMNIYEVNQRAVLS